ncbi:hypothetical protein QVD17_31944 [Tagetes erecta]|uniref:Uncharacterized protein n=1 Tax=Tagetes erecta TaxID=13708 RepID=A0AAD8K800_TARER|nr:hypothetical protein QVD17_31944 [Tagetes erecta]
MGRKLDALRRKFGSSKLRTAIDLAISRLAILKNQRRARFTIAHSDVVQLLQFNHHQQALVRVEQVIKDQNMLVVYDMIHDYCHLLKQKINLIEQTIYCPEELKEAVSSLLYAAPRCGEFPELKEIRAILTARFGMELVNGSTELKSNNGVSQKMIQKLSSKELSLESRTRMLIGIAKENGIVLQLDAMVLPEKVEKVMSLSESMKKYGNIEDAAQDDFQSARSESIHPDRPDSPDSQPEKTLNFDLVKSKSNMIDSISRYDSESDYEEIIEEDEDEDERSTYNMKVEDFDDLYPDDYSYDENIKSFENMNFDENKYKVEKEETGFPSRTAYFSSYKRFPFRHQTNPEARLDR